MLVDDGVWVTRQERFPPLVRTQVDQDHAQSVVRVPVVHATTLETDLLWYATRHVRLSLDKHERPIARSLQVAEQTGEQKPPRGAQGDAWLGKDVVHVLGTVMVSKTAFHRAEHRLEVDPPRSHRLQVTLQDDCECEPRLELIWFLTIS